jgi:hypothetical protein
MGMSGIGWGRKAMYNPEQEKNLRQNWVVMCHRFARLVKCFCFIMWRFTAK